MSEDRLTPREESRVVAALAIGREQSAIAIAGEFHIRPAPPQEFAPRVVNRFGTTANWQTRWKEMISDW